MTTSCGSEGGGTFRPEDVDLVFVDENERPLRTVALWNQLSRQRL